MTFNVKIPKTCNLYERKFVIKKSRALSYIEAPDSIFTLRVWNVDREMFQLNAPYRWIIIPFYEWDFFFPLVFSQHTKVFLLYTLYPRRNSSCSRNWARFFFSSFRIYKIQLCAPDFSNRSRERESLLFLCSMKFCPKRQRNCDDRNEYRGWKAETVWQYDNVGFYFVR